MLSKIVFSAMFSLLLFSGVAFSQEEEVEAVQSGSSAIIVRSSADSDGLVTGTTVMALDSSELGDHPMIFSSPMGGEAFSFEMSGSGFSLLNNTSVQKDLDLVDEQMQQIEEINKEFSARMKEKMADFKGEDGSIQAAGIGELLTELRQQQQEQIDSILLPNQQDRLKQVSLRMKMQRMGSEKALTNHLASELGISADQKQRIHDKSKKLKKEVEEKIAELQANAKKELMAELTSEQRKKLDDLLGDDFVVKEEDSKNRFQKFFKNRKSTSRDF